MSQSEKENLNPKDQEQVQDTMSDEEFEKKQKKEQSIIQLALDFILSFFE